MTDSMLDLQEFLEHLLAESDRQVFRQGVVTAVGANRVSLTIGGGATVIPNVRYLASYAPTIGDTVWIAVNSQDIFVLGKLA